MFAVASEQPDEIVKLRQGEIMVEVERLTSPERFRVATLDAEIEVKGTAFTVVAYNGQLTKVDVIRGLVVVRVQENAPVFLGPGERWEKPEVAPDVVAPQPRSPSITQPPASRSQHWSIKTGRPRRLPSVGAGLTLSAAERAFADGWQALRADRLPEAAAAFARSVAAAGDQPISEDAWFWMAVCQARIPRSTEARASLARFIDRFPGSPRIGQAAAMLGWILVDQGDLDGAADRFGLASHDPVDEVKKSAAQGLRTIEQSRSGGPP